MTVFSKCFAAFLISSVLMRPALAQTPSTADPRPRTKQRLSPLRRRKNLPLLHRRPGPWVPSISAAWSTVLQL